MYCDDCESSPCQCCEWCEMSPCECVDDETGEPYNAAERLCEKVASHDPELALALAEAINGD